MSDRNAREELLRSLRDSPAILEAFAASMPGEALHRRRSSHWTVYEHLEHLVTVQEVLLARLQLFAAEELPEIRPYVPPASPAGEQAGRTGLPALLGRYRELRERQLQAIEAAAPEVWRRRGAHPEYTLYSYEILVRHILLHDYFHMYRMEDLWLARDEVLSDL